MQHLRADAAAAGGLLVNPNHPGHQIGAVSPPAGFGNVAMTFVPSEWTPLLDVITADDTGIALASLPHLNMFHFALSGEGYLQQVLIPASLPPFFDRGHSFMAYFSGFMGRAGRYSNLKAEFRVKLNTPGYVSCPGTLALSAFQQNVHYVEFFRLMWGCLDRYVREYQLMSHGYFPAPIPIVRTLYTILMLRAVFSDLIGLRPDSRGYLSPLRSHFMMQLRVDMRHYTVQTVHELPVMRADLSTCSVCLEPLLIHRRGIYEFQDLQGQDQVCIAPCHHGWHSSCIFDWFTAQVFGCSDVIVRGVTCPVCRDLLFHPCPVCQEYMSCYCERERVVCFA